MAPLSLGFIGPQFSPELCRLFFSFLKNVRCEIYERGGRYDLVWFLNATEELRFIKQNTATKTLVVGMEPPGFYVYNYDPSLLRLSDRYMGYLDFAGSYYAGKRDSDIFHNELQVRIKESFRCLWKLHRDINFVYLQTMNRNQGRDSAGTGQAKQYPEQAHFCKSC